MSYDPLPADGVGSELFDEPSLFYLTNQQLIEEWNSLRTEVSSTLNSWFSTTVREALAEPARRLGLDVSLAQGPAGHRHAVMHLPNTTILSGKPVIGVGIAWLEKRVMPTTKSVFSCVRCSRTRTGKEAARLFLDAGGRDVRVALQAKGADSETWPIWRWVSAEHGWWSDLDSYCERLVESAAELAEAVIEPLRAASFVQAVDLADDEDS